MLKSYSVFVVLCFAMIYHVLGSQNTCSGRTTSHGRTRRGSHAGQNLKRSPASRPAFYGVKTSSIDVAIKAQAAGSTTIYVNGEIPGPNSSSSCGQPAQGGVTLNGGEVIAFTATTGSDPQAHGEPITGFLAAILAADGSQVYATTGQDGWKATHLSMAADGWMLPGFDDSDWVPLSAKAWVMDCNITPFDGTGTQCTWNQSHDNIAVRYTVPREGCKCTEGQCPNGYCYNCLYHEGDQRDVCYDGWTEVACNDGGEDYTWCGDQ